MTMAQMDNSLAGKVALVTGGGRGIGRAISETLAAHGVRVAVLDIKEAFAEDAAASIREAGGAAMAMAGDVSKRQTFIDAIGTLEKEYGRFDILVNNAIWARYGAIADITPEMLDRMVGSGFNSIVWGIQAAAPAMTRSGGGSIINIASVAGYLGLPNALVYCGVKAGVMGLTRSAATDLGPHGIRVNSIAPGTVPTEGATINADREKMQTRVARTPLRRLGTVQDIAAAARFLASDESAYMTGDAISVDGGITHAFL